jgi:hypothetical protein
MPDRRELFSLLGEIGVLFSNLAFFMSSIFSRLVDTSAWSIGGSLVSDEFTVAKTTELIRKLAEYRFAHRPEMAKRASELCDEVDKVRHRRNLFTHGEWVCDEAQLAQGKVTVLEMRWTKDRKTEQWQRLAEHALSFEELRELRDTLGRLVLAGAHFEQDLRTEPMLPSSRQGELTETPE